MNRSEINNFADAVLAGQNPVFPDYNQLDSNDPITGLEGLPDSYGAGEEATELDANQSIVAIINYINTDLKQRHEGLLKNSGKTRARKTQVFYNRFNNAFEWLNTNAPLWATVTMMRVHLALNRLPMNTKKFPMWLEFTRQNGKRLGAGPFSKA